MTVSLRPYQLDALDAISTAHERGLRRVLVGLPCGTGKTVMFGRLAAQAAFDGLHTRGMARFSASLVSTDTLPGRVLILAHRDELIQQAKAKLAAIEPRSAEYIGIVKADRDETDFPIVLASVQTVSRQRRLDRLIDSGCFDLVICDEAHHSTADTWMKVLEGVGCLGDDPPLTLGVSATLMRNDNKALGDLWEQVVYHRDILEMIDEGWLCDLRGITVKLKDLDLGDVRTSRGDYVAADLGEALSNADAAEAAVRAYRRHADGRKTLIFTPTVATSVEMCEAFEAGGYRAAHVDGTTHDDARRLVMADLRMGNLDVVTNCALWCLDLETEILTSVGWVSYDEMTAEHKVANWSDGGIEFKPYLDYYLRDREEGERMVTLSTPYRNLRVTETHRMLYRWPQRKSRWLKVPATDLVGRARISLPASGVAPPDGACPEQPEQDERELRYKTPSELSLDECRLIGFWLGDGHKNELHSGGVEYVLTQSLAYPIIVGWVDGLLGRVGIDFRRRVQVRGTSEYPDLIRWSLPRGTGRGSQRRNGVFPIEPYLSKRGSRYLWGLNEDQFEAFVEGWWYADGNHGQGDSRPKTMIVTNADYSLLSHVQAIAASRGWKTNLYRAGPPQRPHHRQVWKLSFGRGDHSIGRGYELHHEEGWSSEKVWCVKTDTRNIVTRRRGSVVVMGNTEGADIPELECIVIARPTKSQILYVQMIGRGARVHPGKADCLVLDLVGATEQKSLVTLPRLFGIDEQGEDEENPQTVTEALADAEEKRREGELVSRTVDLFKRSYMTWKAVDERRWLLSTFELRLGLTMEDDGTWAAVASRKGVKGSQVTIASGIDLGLAQGIAEDYLRQHSDPRQAAKQARWRKHSATDDQLRALRNLGVAVTGRLTRGDASDLIDVNIIRKGLRRRNR